MQLAEKMQDLGTEIAFDVLEEVKSMTTAGRDVISLAIGEPDFTTPEVIKEAGISAIRADKTGYSPSAGLPELRRELAHYLNRTRNANYSQEETVVAPGAKPLLFYGLLALIKPGMEVIYPNPGFPIYESVIRLMGGVPVPLPLRSENEFQFSPVELKKLITPNTGGIIINSPHNPTGTVINSTNMEQLAEIVRAYELWAIADEVYSELVYEETASSLVNFPGMKEQTLLIDSFSKSYAMTGWRIGFAGGSQKLINAISRLITNSVSCTATFTQHAALAALQEAGTQVEEMRDILQERAELVAEQINAIEGIHCLKPAGSYYCYIDVTLACRQLNLANSRELQEYLLQEAGVALLYQDCFGGRLPEEKGEFLRLSFASCDKSRLKEATARIDQAINQLHYQVS